MIGSRKISGSKVGLILSSWEQNQSQGLDTPPDQTLHPRNVSLGTSPCTMILAVAWMDPSVLLALQLYCPWSEKVTF